MFDRRNFIDVHGINLDKWVKRWDLEILEHHCSSCGAPTRTTIPFFYGQIRGVRSPSCECGNTDVPYICVRDPKFGDLLDTAK